MIGIRNLVLACGLFSLALATDIRGRIIFNATICSDITELGPARVLLDDGTFSGGVTRDGVFVIPGVPEGTYMLSVNAHSHTFDQLRVDVVNSTVEVRPYVPGTPLDPPTPVLLSHPVLLFPRLRHIHYVPPQSFNVFGMFQNPMMLMMVGGGVLMLAMPWITSQLLDPEAVKEMQSHQSKILNGGLSGLLSDEPAPSSAKASTVQAKARSKGSKRR